MLTITLHLPTNDVVIATVRTKLDAEHFTHAYLTHHNLTDDVDVTLSAANDPTNAVAPLHYDSVMHEFVESRK